MKGTNQVVIVGAGASGLMAAREIGKAGRKALVLEARDRIGGRIYPLSKEEFGYPAEGGAEFVHGKAKLTRSLVDEAGLTYVPTEGESWRVENGKLVKRDRVLPYRDLLQQRLNDLKIDIPIATFLEKHFGEEQYLGLRNSILEMVKGYDAADPNRASALALREEMFGDGNGWQQGRIKEGYGALVDFLASECQQAGCEIRLNCEVKAIERHDCCNIYCVNGEIHQAQNVIVTLPLPLISRIKFVPAIPQKLEAANRVGFGSVVKVLMRFRQRWWSRAGGHDLTRLMFIFSGENIPTWWTQYPESHPTLTGWIGGPSAENFKDVAPGDVLDIAYGVLAKIFGVSKQAVKDDCLTAKALRWSTDPYALGAYSYVTVETEAARRELMAPVANAIYFAGEALFDGSEASTVEGALASGRNVAKKLFLT